MNFEAFSNPWFWVFLVITVAAILYARRASTEGSGTLGVVAAIGAGVIGIGLLLLVLPWAAGATAAFDFVPGDEYSVMTGASYVLGIIAIIAGLVLMRHKESGS